jgi:hypothetical protein
MVSGDTHQMVPIPPARRQDTVPLRHYSDTHSVRGISVATASKVTQSRGPHSRVQNFFLKPSETPVLLGWSSFQLRMILTAIELSPSSLKVTPVAICGVS